MDILLAHGYFLNEDPHERQVMKPYPPLGILYLASYLKREGFDVGVFDSTFASLDDFAALLAREQPPVVGLYVNLMTKFNALKLIRLAKSQGALVILGGPEPAYYAADYLTRGADIVVKGEGRIDSGGTAAASGAAWPARPEQHLGHRLPGRQRPSGRDFAAPVHRRSERESLA